VGDCVELSSFRAPTLAVLLPLDWPRSLSLLSPIAIKGPASRHPSALFDQSPSTVFLVVFPYWLSLALADPRRRLCSITLRPPLSCEPRHLVIIDLTPGPPSQNRLLGLVLVLLGPTHSGPPNTLFPQVTLLLFHTPPLPLRNPLPPLPCSNCPCLFPHG
jgi:hypothetical protein